MKIMCHPQNLEWLKEQIPQLVEPSPIFTRDIEIIADNNMRVWKQRWAFPKDRFIEYEKTDEKWAIPLRFGKWEDTNEREFYVVNEMLFSRLYNFPIVMPKYNIVITNIT